METLPAVKPAVHLASDRLPVTLSRVVGDAPVLEVADEDARGDVSVERELWVLLERNPQLLSVASVVRPASELDEPSTVVAGAVTRVCVPEVGPPLVVIGEVLRT